MPDTPLAVCPLCQRPLDGPVTRHHLYPQKYGRKPGHKARAHAFPVITLHKVCHRMIHALFSERDLAEHLNSVDALRAHPAMQPFLQFIAGKSPSFEVRVRSDQAKHHRDR